MSWKQKRWTLLAAAIAAGVCLRAHAATAQPSSCPELSRVPWIVLGMLVATASIHATMTFLQVEGIHIGKISAWCSKRGERRFFLVAIGALMTAATLLADIIVWAWVYRHVGAIDSLEESLYFSGATFTTVGYGDVTLAKCWQLLSVGEAVNGVLMAGWSTAQLIYLVQRMMAMSMHPEATKIN